MKRIVKSFFIAFIFALGIAVIIGSSGGGEGGSSDQLVRDPEPWTMINLPDTGQTSSYTATWGEDSDYTINPPSYTDNGDGTVTDNVTSLVWQKESVSDFEWGEAITYCKDLTIEGYSDWRLPTKKELVSIVDFGTYSPSPIGSVPRALSVIEGSSSSPLRTIS